MQLGRGGALVLLGAAHGVELREPRIHVQPLQQRVAQEVARRVVPQLGLDPGVPDPVGRRIQQRHGIGGQPTVQAQGRHLQLIPLGE